MPVLVTNERALCGMSTTFILFAVAAASLAIALVEIVDKGWDGAVGCGFNGKPPLLEYILGTGIAYLIIACASFRISHGKGEGCSYMLLSLSNLFVFTWAIVGAFSLWQDGTNCKALNKMLYRMGYSAVIISFFLCCCGGFMFTAVYTEEEKAGGENNA
jgi:hypothetical protein